MMLTWRQVAATQARPRLERFGVLERSNRRIEPVHICSWRYGYAPWRFLHQGELRRVYRIERSWEAGPHGQCGARRYFTLRCNDEQSYTLFQDLKAGTWYLER